MKRSNKKRCKSVKLLFFRNQVHTINQTKLEFHLFDIFFLSRPDPEHWRDSDLSTWEKWANDFFRHKDHTALLKRFDNTILLIRHATCFRCKPFWQTSRELTWYSVDSIPFRGFPQWHWTGCKGTLFHTAVNSWGPPHSLPDKFEPVFHAINCSICWWPQRSGAS